ncbi:MAG: hypothetical protein ABF649_12065 [Bacillus sp. (in: firmicutes)]
MDGALFYWFTWMLWIVTTFFMKKENKYRCVYSISLLLAIITSPYQLTFLGFTVSWLLVIMLASAFVYTAFLRKGSLIYFSASVFFTMLAYCTFHLLAILDPVWILFDQKWMLAIVLMIIARLLYSNPLQQIMLIMFGSINGEIMYGLILKKYEFTYIIGDLHYFDCLLISITVMTTIYVVKGFLSKWEQHVYIMEKEKQKLS